MDSPDLSDLLKKIAARPTPELPANFEQNVWREIRLRTQVAAREPLWDTLFQPFFRPVGILAATMVAILVSVSFGTFGSATNAVHHSLNLGVFSAEAPTLPSTLLGHAR